MIGDMRGRGLLFGVELVAGPRRQDAGERDSPRRSSTAASTRGSASRSPGLVLTLSPPLTIAREDLDRALSIVEESVGQAIAAPAG